jgi:hypothetical protein
VSAKDPVGEKLLAELALEERSVDQAGEAWREAQANWTVATRRYAAVRDMVREHFDHSPYRKGFRWPPSVVRGDLRGPYRFIHMSPEDAVIAALSEGQGSMPVDQIVEALRSGGLGLPDATIHRAISTALSRTQNIKMDADGKYSYEESATQWLSKKVKYGAQSSLEADPLTPDISYHNGG